MKKLLVLFAITTVKGYGQSDPSARNAFMHRDILEAFDYWNISRPATTFHSSFKPYLSSTFRNATDTVVPFRFYAFKNFFFSKTLNERPEKRNWYNLQFHPLVDMEAGFDVLTGKPVNSAAGGMHFKTNINNDFTFAATIYGGRQAYPFFLDTSVSMSHLVPEAGQGYPKAGGYTFSDFTGYVSYTPNNNKVFNFQAGRGKHFIGDGYRSVLLSDYAPAYPYFRINTNIWRIQYNVWYTVMNDVTGAGGIQNKYNRKYGTFHYLSYNIVKELNIGLFENVIWRGSDTNQSRTFDINYLNPVIFMRPVEYALGSPDNSFIGLNLNATIMKKVKIYGQLGLDEFYLKEIRARKGWWANKQAWQLGLKYINAFGITGLKLQAEYNQVRPYTYSHGLVDQNYSHYGQPLAHPFGANFKELLGIMNYRKKSWQLNVQGMYAVIGKDSADSRSNVGQNIFLSYNTRPFDYGHHTGQGVPTTVLQSQIKFTWFVIPDMNLRLELGYIQRSESNTRGYALQNPYLFVGIRSSFWNIYRDF
jgi:hypothetical protein